MNNETSYPNFDSAMETGSSLLRDALRWKSSHPDKEKELADSLLNQGIALFQSGRREEAEAMLREVLFLHPLHQQASQVLCHILIQQGIEQSQSGAFDKAIAHLREAICLHHDHPDVAHVLGITLLNKAIECFHAGRIVEADAVLREVLRLLPEHPLAKQALVQTLIKKSIGYSQEDRLMDAVDVLREALYLAPNDQGVLFQLSRLTFEAGNTEEALSLACRLLKLAPDNANYVGWSCLILNSIGDIGGTEDRIRHFIDLVKSGGQTVDINPNEIIRIYSEVLILRKDYDRALNIFTELAQTGFHQTVCATAIADVLLAKDDDEQALAVISPFAESTWSRTFVTASIAQFRITLRKMGLDLPQRLLNNPRSGSSISISSLSNFGRFGQQMCEYLFLYLYARKHHLTLETPEWVGHYFFELDDPLLIAHKYVTRKGQRDLLRQAYLNDVSPLVVDTDIWSPGGPWDNWMPGVSMLPVQDRELVQSLLKPRQQWLPYLQPALNKLNASGKTIVALHLRRGDRVAMNDITQTSLYLDWLARIWPTLENPVLFIASDDISSVKNDFSLYNPFSLADLTEPWKNNEYLQDFYILMNCDILGISTGGFAASASLLNNRARLFICASSDNQSIITFSPYIVQDNQPA